jgi:hypothetical protein
MGVRRAQDRRLQHPRRHGQIVAKTPVAAEEIGVFTTPHRPPGIGRLAVRGLVAARRHRQPAPASTTDVRARTFGLRLWQRAWTPSGNSSEQRSPAPVCSSAGSPQSLVRLVERTRDGQRTRQFAPLNRRINYRRPGHCRTSKEVGVAEHRLSSASRVSARCRHAALIYPNCSRANSTLTRRFQHLTACCLLDRRRYCRSALPRFAHRAMLARPGRFPLGSVGAPALSPGPRCHRAILCRAPYFEVPAAPSGCRPSEAPAAPREGLSEG